MPEYATADITVTLARFDHAISHRTREEEMGAPVDPECQLNLPGITLRSRHYAMLPLSRLSAAHVAAEEGVHRVFDLCLLPAIGARHVAQAGRYSRYQRLSARRISSAS
jgi:hypothetical protein